MNLRFEEARTMFQQFMNLIEQGKMCNKAGSKRTLLTIIFRK